MLWKTNEEEEEEVVWWYSGSGSGSVGTCQFLIHLGRQVSEGACYCYLLGGGGSSGACWVRW